MTSLLRCTCNATLIGLCLAAASEAYAQVGSINSDIVSTRVYNDVPGATLTTVNNYPALVSFTEQNVSAPTGYANRDVWHFSSDSGGTAYQFQNSDYFSMSMNLTLTGDPTSTLRKEAGFVFNNPANDGGEFILDTDAHEIVAFGGFLPFYAFPSTFNSGNTVTMGIAYENVGGVNSIMYSANGVDSPWLAFSNTELGVINGTSIGGYFQIQQDPNVPSNSGSAVFGGISVSSIPEPSAFALLGLGIVSFLFRRRHI
jgi:hypothetical protein